MADESDSVDLTSIHGDLHEIKQSLQGTVTKSDLENALSSLVKQKDLKDLVTNIVGQLLESFRDSIVKDFNEKLRERTGKLHDKLDSLAIENEDLRERIRSRDRTIETLEEKVGVIERRANEAMKLANYNEQYSRKHNIRILNYEEKEGENLCDDFVKLVKKDLGVTVKNDEIQAIHRIPGKEGYSRPVIVKVKNTEVKSRIMRKRKDLKKEVKFYDDITQRNLGLMARLHKSEKFEGVWFFNDSVYGKTSEGMRYKFDIFDNITERLKQKGRKDSK